ncbi:hypothetical protein ACFY8H_08370 [Streptomyces bacillaris]|uniref:hypothetical protein n=1 Tax=Streptomyces bacillaris TaxID=68179 RepID=UPI0036C784C8
MTWSAPSCVARTTWVTVWRAVRPVRSRCTVSWTLTGTVPSFSLLNSSSPSARASSGSGP